MSDSILNTNGQNKIDNDLVFVGAKQNGQYMTGFTDKIFVIDLEKLPDQFDLDYFPKAIADYTLSSPAALFSLQPGHWDDPSIVTRYFVTKQDIKLKEVHYWDLIENHEWNFIFNRRFFYLPNPSDKIMATSTSTIPNDWELLDNVYHKHIMTFSNLTLVAEHEYMIPSYAFDNDVYKNCPIYNNHKTVSDYYYLQYRSNPEGSGGNDCTSNSLYKMIPLELVIEVNSETLTVLF